MPENYCSIYNHVVNNGFARVEEMDFCEFVGERFIADNIVVFEVAAGPFPATELSVLENVSERFKGLSSIVDISHDEPAWLDDVDDYHKRSFEYGFELKNID